MSFQKVFTCIYKINKHVNHLQGGSYLTGDFIDWLWSETFICLKINFHLSENHSLSFKSRGLSDSTFLDLGWTSNMSEKN